jgi:hypothetical protein
MNEAHSHKPFDPDEDSPPPVSPFDDQTGPLTFRIIAWRTGLIVALAIIALTLLVTGSWIMMRLYR